MGAMYSLHRKKNVKTKKELMRDCIIMLRVFYIFIDRQVPGSGTYIFFEIDRLHFFFHFSVFCLVNGSLEFRWNFCFVDKWTFLTRL